MTGIKWKRMLAALCCAFIAISGGCANPNTSSGSSVSQESGIPASQETSETQAPSQMAESAYEPSAPSSSVPESQSKPPESGRPSVAWSSIDDILAGMSLRDKICQMLVLSPELLTGVSGVTAAGETTRQALVDMPVGGLIYSRPNLKSRQQVCKMLSNTQSYSKIPLILTCDEEGGRVNRLMSTVGTTYIGPMFGYRDQGAETARQNAHTIASDMRVLGFNADLAPVADVWSNPDNTVIGDRAYSDDFAQAAELIPEAVRGFHSGGVATTLKHFPGHGDTLADSHDGAVYVSKPLEQLRREELLPFRAGIASGSDMVMIGHLILTEIDAAQPAPFSYRIVTELLREELGFQGVVITDGLQMKALTDSYTSGEIARRAVSAGVDILLCPSNPQAAVSALEEAVALGEISEERINQSVRRILAMKVNRGVLKLEG